MSIYLRELRREDADISYKWRNDKKLWKWTDSAPNCEVTPTMEREWYERVSQDPTRINMAICDAQTNTYIGNIYLVNIKDRAGEIGIVIGNTDFSGHGYGAEAIRLFVKYLRSHYSIDRITVRLDLQNQASLRTFLYAGAVCKKQTWVEMEL